MITDSKTYNEVSLKNKKTDDVIKQMEKEWPEMTKEFKKIQKEQYELFLHKCWYTTTN